MIISTDSFSFADKQGALQNTVNMLQTALQARDCLIDALFIFLCFDFDRRTVFACASCCAANIAALEKMLAEKQGFVRCL
jgi:hypothetical protein